MTRKVLVCDDEKHIVRLIQVNLERQGYAVFTAFDGEEALAKVRSEKPDLVILDVMMPKMSGLEVLKIIRSEPETKNLTVIVVSVMRDDEEVAEAYRCGADMHLTKPFHPLDLIPPWW